MVQKEGIRKLTSAISAKGDGYDSASEDFELETWSAPWSWGTFWAKRLDCVGEPLLCRVDADSCSALNQSVQMIVLLEIDRVFDE